MRDKKISNKLFGSALALSVIGGISAFFWKKPVPKFQSLIKDKVREMNKKKKEAANLIQNLIKKYRGSTNGKKTAKAKDVKKTLIIKAVPVKAVSEGFKAALNKIFKK